MNTFIKGFRDPEKMANPRLKTIALGYAKLRLRVHKFFKVFS